MHVLVVLAHPEPGSFSQAVADAYCKGVEAAEHTWELADLYREGFERARYAAVSRCTHASGCSG